MASSSDEAHSDFSDVFGIYEEGRATVIVILNCTLNRLADDEGMTMSALC